MKKVILFALGIYLVLFAIFSGGTFDALIVLFIAGSIPGTTASIPADAMLLFWGVLAWLMLVRLAIIPLLKFGYDVHKPLIEQAKPLDATKASSPKTTPKRRYSAIGKNTTKPLSSAK